MIDRAKQRFGNWDWAGGRRDEGERLDTETYVRTTRKRPPFEQQMIDFSLAINTQTAAAGPSLLMTRTLTRHFRWRSLLGVTAAHGSRGTIPW